MTDCLNEEIRDRLALLAHGTLAAAEVATVRAHLSVCAVCREELEVLDLSRRVLNAAVPRVDQASILAALPAPRLQVMAGAGSRPASVPRRRGLWMPRQYLAAAASLLIVASLAPPLLRNMFDDPAVSAGPDTSVAPTTQTQVGMPTPVSSAGLSVAAGLGDLSDDDLTALLAELDRFEPTIAAEPTAMRTPIVSPPEGI